MSYVGKIANYYLLLLPVITLPPVVFYVVLL